MTLEVHMRQMVWTLWREEDGQDTIEYVLLLAFIVIAATAVLGFNTNSIRGIASTSNSQLEAAARFAAS
jgi:Flp pilus assembly pilin Flp